MRILILIILLFALSNCKSQNSDKMKHQYTNDLINSTSPYLLQHAHNPVNWQPWSDDLVEKATKENKLILVSIGYAACHWCHVMEHECFEDTAVANIMNENFICVKVDREERPDVDHYYMTAVQLMQQQGGWPLNVIALPNGSPIWGGTYFPKDMWVKNILAVADFNRKNPDKTKEYAENLQTGIQQMSLTAEVKNVVPANAKLLERGVMGWKTRFDMKNGGRIGNPKFPMPVTLEFLLYYGFIKNDSKTLDYVELTLEAIARGGIYDQLGGGFARYSVDDKWKVPHFEKMLYDNGQMLSIYSKGFQQYKNNEFKIVVDETVDFIERELMDETGAFYSSLDADSEGEEGKFYVWNLAELKENLGDDLQLFSDYYNVNSLGFWEHGNYILLRKNSNKKFAEKNNLTMEQLQQKVDSWKAKLLTERSKRVRPGLDDKTLTSWNALVIQGLTDAYKTFKNERFLDLAVKNATFLRDNQLENNGKMFHSWKQGKSSIDGFLEDYALTIQSYISLFEVTGNADWLTLAGKLNAYALNHFYDEKKAIFYFSEKDTKTVITNHFQNEDNVIPAANSVMANNLHKLYLIMGRPEYLTIAKKMVQHVTPQFVNYPMAYSNWGTYILKTTEPYFEVAVCGKNSNEILKEMLSGFQPNILWSFSEKTSEIPILKDRFIKAENLIYVCQEGVCQLPVKTAAEAFNLFGVAR